MTDIISVVRRPPVLGGAVTNSNPADTGVVGTDPDFASEAHVHQREQLPGDVYDPTADQTLVAGATTVLTTDPLILDSGRLLTAPATSLLWLDTITPPSQFAQQNYQPTWPETLLAGYETIVETDPLILGDGELITVPDGSLLWTDGPRTSGTQNRLPFVNVMDFGFKADGGTTDNSGPIQAAIDSLTVLGGIIVFPYAGLNFAVCTQQINLNSRTAPVIFMGQGGYDAGASTSTILRFTGTGSGSFFNCQNTFGVQFHNIYFQYTSSSFTGDIIDFRNVSGADTAYALVNACTFAASFSPGTARSMMNFDKAIISTVRDCSINSGLVGILGKTSDSSYSNSIKITGCEFKNNVNFHIKDAGNNWVVQGNTFEACTGGFPIAYGHSASSTADALLWQGNWGGDATAAGTYMTFNGDNLCFIGNYVGMQFNGSKGLVFDVNTNRGVTVFGNQFIGTASSTGVDFGVTTGNAGVSILGNYFNGTTTNIGGTVPVGAITQDANTTTFYGPVLAAGTATMAPLQMTSGTNLTSAVAGGVEFDGAAFYKTSDTTTGRKFDDSWHYFRLTGSGTGITTIADFFGTNDGIPLVASAIYEIEWNCYFSQATSAGTATWTIVTATTALANLTGEYVGSPIGGIGAVGTPQTAAINVTSSSSTAFPVTGSEAVATHYFRVRVLATAGAGSSNTRLRLAMSAGTATPLINSYFRVRRLAAANVGTYVA